MNAKYARLIELATLLCLTGFFIYVASHVLGIGIWDDSFALQEGTWIDRRWFLHLHNYAPLYSYWFKLLAIFWPNAIWRYFVSWGLIVTSIALVPALLRIPRAWVYTLLVLTYPFLEINPYVGIFTAALLILSLSLLMKQERTAAQALFAACLTCFVISFCRPEYDYGVFFSAAATLVALLVEARSPKTAPGRHEIALAATAITVVCLVSVIVFAMRSSPSGRSGVAFAQHYNMRAAEHGFIPKEVDFWSSDYAERAFGVDPGRNAVTGSSRLQDFYRANPRLFRAHVFENLRDYRTLILLAVLAALLSWPWLRTDRRHLRPLSLFLACMCVPVLIAVVLIYPRDHYAVALVPALLLYAVQLPGRWARLSPASFLLPAMALIWFLDIHARVQPGTPWHYERVNLRRIQCARRVDASAPSRSPLVFDVTPIIDTYFIQRRETLTLAHLPDWREFTSWAIEKRPAWIATDATLPTLYGVSPEQLDQFLRGDLGYTAHACSAEAAFTIYTDERP